MKIKNSLWTLVFVVLLATSAWAQGSPMFQWTAHCNLADGRKLLTDGSLVLDSKYFPNVSLPERSMPPEAVQRLMDSSTDREFGLEDLNRTGSGGHYIAPGSIQLNQKYINLLRGLSLKPALRFRAKGINDPVLILDGSEVIGVMMPMKS